MPRLSRWLNQTTYLDPVVQAYHSREAVIFNTNETHTAAAFPLLHDGTLFAEIVLYSSQPGFFSTTRMQTLQAFANLSGMALRNSDLYRAGENRSAANGVSITPVGGSAGRRTKIYRYGTAR
jgi:GAF domain-containing protein